jgi:hypothetical protein
MSCMRCTIKIEFRFPGVFDIFLRHPHVSTRLLPQHRMQLSLRAHDKSNKIVYDVRKTCTTSSINCL